MPVNVVMLSAFVLIAASLAVTLPESSVTVLASALVAIASAFVLIRASNPLVTLYTVSPETALVSPSSTFPSGLKACNALYTAPPDTKPALFAATAPSVVSAVVTFVSPTVRPVTVAMPPLIAPVPTFRLPPLIAPLAVIVVTPVNAPPLSVAVPSVILLTVVAPALNVPSIVVTPSVAVIFCVLSCNVLMEDSLVFTFCTKPLLSSPTVDFNELIAEVFSLTLDFKAPTEIESPSITVSAMLPEPIAALLSVALVSVAPVSVAPSVFT